MTHDIEWLDSLSTDEAINELRACCGSRRWASEMVNARPFKSVDQLLERAGKVWWGLEAEDWLEAFRSHPKIGEKKAEIESTQRAQQWSGQEQSGIKDASQETIDVLATLNREYESKFGYIFIVCATGKSPDEMLAILRQRIKHDAASELRIAAGEQSKITELRLKKLLG